MIPSKALRRYALLLENRQPKVHGRDRKADNSKSKGGRLTASGGSGTPMNYDQPNRNCWVALPRLFPQFDADMRTGWINGCTWANALKLRARFKQDKPQLFFECTAAATFCALCSQWLSPASAIDKVQLIFNN